MDSYAAQLAQITYNRKTSTLSLIEVAGLVIILWDTVTYFETELTQIWSSSTPLSMKCTYSFLRYSTLVYQSINILLIDLRISKAPVSSRTCTLWFVFQIVVAHIFWFTVQGILMKLVFTLHPKQRKIKAALVGMFCLEKSFEIGASVVFLLNLENDDMCITRRRSSETTYACLIVQVFFFSLAILTVVKARSSISQGMRPYVIMIAREILWVGSLTALVCFPIALFSVHTAEVLVSWPLSLLSIVGCRLVLRSPRFPPDVYQAGDNPAEVAVEESIELAPISSNRGDRHPNNSV
ncbi:hypothetical protein BDQ12DRAFT_671811 [Crucibulum laeve]|uniref:DUF6533 domain-containing protein n=1 Tax=Crucibulum laeve TaxID=68775 RepID=A0A5C3LFX7_9AGAR|nr:hypothetical protein BDQ12DRAFT_671811 [Crucibulum laeve]